MLYNSFKSIILLFIITLVACSSELTDKEKQNIEIFNNNRDSVVFISTKKRVIDYYTYTRYTVPKGSGSGFVWDRVGHIVTNFHVVRGASIAKVKLHNGKIYRASIVGIYPRRDIAVLKIDAPQSELKPVAIGTSKDLQVGQSVFAIGNPYGLDWTMTKGIISALNRKVPSSDGVLMTRAIQTDAAINPGNSGGIMLDSSGRVIGVNSAIYTPNGGNVGIGFAIPIDLVKHVVDKLINFGKYVKPSIGIETDGRFNTYLKKNMGISGIAVLGVISGSDAYKKQLKPAKLYSDGTVEFGDIILGVNGEKVGSISDLDDILERQKIGSIVKLEILREGKKIKVPIELIGLDNQ